MLQHLFSAFITSKRIVCKRGSYAYQRVQTGQVVRVSNNLLQHKESWWCQVRPGSISYYVFVWVLSLQIWMYLWNWQQHASQGQQECDCSLRLRQFQNNIQVKNVTFYTVASTPTKIYPVLCTQATCPITLYTGYVSNHSIMTLPHHPKNRTNLTWGPTCVAECAALECEVDEASGGPGICRQRLNNMQRTTYKVFFKSIIQINSRKIIFTPIIVAWSVPLS